MKSLIQNRWIAFLFFSFAFIFFAGQNMSLKAKPLKSKSGFLGVSVQELTPSLRQALNLGDKKGLLVSAVVEDSPAEVAGLKEEDVILKFDGKQVELADEFSKLVRKTGAGTKVNLTIFRNGKTKNLEVELRRKKRRNTFSWAQADPGLNVMFFGHRPKLGVEYHDLDEKTLAAYFNVEQRSGVLILKVTRGTPAEKGGLLPGDVIIAIDDEKINDGDDLIDTLSDYEGGEEIAVTIMRKGKKSSIKVELEESALHSDDIKMRYRKMPHLEHLRWQDDENVFLTPGKSVRPRIYKFKSDGDDKQKEVEIIIDPDESI